MTQRPVSALRIVGIALALVGLLSTTSFRTAHAAGEVGSVAANFTITNVLDGPSPVTLSEYAGSVVCIAFFAYW